MVYMPAASDGSKYLEGIRDDSSGCAEYRAVRKAGSQAVAKFSNETWVTRYFSSHTFVELQSDTTLPANHRVSPAPWRFTSVVFWDPCPGHLKC